MCVVPLQSRTTTGEFRLIPDDSVDDRVGPDNHVGRYVLRVRNDPRIHPLSACVCHPLASKGILRNRTPRRSRTYLNRLKVSTYIHLSILDLNYTNHTVDLGAVK